MILHLFGEVIDDPQEILAVKFGRKPGPDGTLWADYSIYDGYSGDECLRRRLHLSEGRRRRISRPFPP